MTDQAIVDTMVARIVTRFQPARILLFGSRARGTDNRWSDVDLLVVMDEVEDKRRAAVEMGRAGVGFLRTLGTGGPAWRMAAAGAGVEQTARLVSQTLACLAATQTA